MLTLFRKTSAKLIIAALAVTVVAGCSTSVPGAKDSARNNSQGVRNQNEIARSQDELAGNQNESSRNRNEDAGQLPQSSGSNSDNTVQQTDPQKERLSAILQLARQGKIINCEFPVKNTVIDTVEGKWGKPDKADWVPAAKGTYATYSKHDVVFGFNKGSQIFEVRSFDDRLGEITLSKVKEVFGAPAYDHKNNEEVIIGYTAGEEYKLLLVFPQAKDSSDNPKLDHYSVLYPKGTVNSMADDPGRQW